MGDHFTPAYSSIPCHVVNAARPEFQTPRKGENQIVLMEKLHWRVGRADSGQYRLFEGVCYEVIGIGAHDGTRAQDCHDGLGVSLREIQQARFGRDFVLTVLKAFYGAYRICLGE